MMNSCCRADHRENADCAPWDLMAFERSPKRLRYRLRRQIYSSSPNPGSGAAEVEASPQTGQIAVSREDVEQLQNQYLRARADLENYRRRVEREREDQRKFANEALIKGLLETVDNLERAIQGAEQTQDAAALHSGVALVHQQFIDSLKRNGVELIDASSGAKFDPRLHEAVMVEANPSFENGAIIECLQSGYVLNGRVLRAAMVRVAKN
jgi:molecular chaperone GrpE